MVRVRLVMLSFSLIVAWGAIWVGAQGEQSMKEKQVMQDAEFSPEEVPGFDTRNGVVNRVDTKWGVAATDLRQTLRRKGTRRPGKDPTEIEIWARLLPDRNIAYQAAVVLTATQFAPVGQPGMPEGSWTGLPVGEKSWTLPLKERNRFNSASLIVWDGRLAVRVTVGYYPPRAKFALSVDQTDWELGGYAARLLISKIKRRLLGSRELPKVRLVVEGQNIEGAKTGEGAVLMPARATLKKLGQKTTGKLGVLTSSWKDQKVVIAVGARTLLIGKQKVPLPLPVLHEKEEMWVEGESLAKALGLKTRWEKGQFVLAKR